VAVKIKLKRMGKIREPYYRIIVADARTKRDGRAIEEIGKYHPKADPSFIEVNSDRAQHWLSVGAQPTDPVRKILEVTGDWQKFKGLPGAEGTLKTAAARSDKKEIFAAALAETLGDSSAASKGKGRAGGAKAGDAKAGEGKAGEGKAGTGKAADAKESRSGRGGRAGAARAKSDKAAADEAVGAGEAGDVTAEAGGKAPAAAEGAAAETTAAETTAAETTAAETTEAAESGSGD
jgi:small subunit ribosomal protein S16